MQLNFGGGVELHLHPLNYLFMHTRESGAYCLGVFDNGHQGTLLGGITFRNVLIKVRVGVYMVYMRCAQQQRRGQ